MEARFITLGATLAMATLLVIGTASAAGIYRWTGEDGTTHYGSSPPPDANAERIRGAAPAPGGSPDTPQTQREDSQRDNEQRRGEARAEEASTARERECSRVRQNLELLEDPSVRRVRTDGGQVEVLTEERRNEMIGTNREFLEEWC